MPASTRKPDRAAATSVESVAPVDLNILIELIGEDPADLQAILASFRVTADRIGKNLHRGMAVGSLSEVHASAHTLKSAAYSIGATRLGKLCAEVEATAESGASAPLAPLCSQLEQELQAVLQYLQSRET